MSRSTKQRRAARVRDVAVALVDLRSRRPHLKARCDTPAGQKAASDLRKFFHADAATIARATVHATRVEKQRDLVNYLVGYTGRSPAAHPPRPASTGKAEKKGRAGSTAKSSG